MAEEFQDSSDIHEARNVEEPKDCVKVRVVHLGLLQEAPRSARRSAACRGAATDSPGCSCRSDHDHHYYDYYVQLNNPPCCLLKKEARKFQSHSVLNQL